MTTVEDVFALYDTKTPFYLNCNKLNKIESCPNKWNDNCYCENSTPINSISIGNTDVPCKLKRKCYVKQGENCPICFDPILTKTTAYLTCCGHSFHKSGIFRAAETNWIENYPGKFHCPACRTYLGTDVHYMSERYNFGRNLAKINYLDIVENFWITKDFCLGELCCNKYDHYLGMKKSCEKCQRFVLYGEYN